MWLGLWVWLHHFGNHCCKYSEASPLVYGLPHKRKKLTDGLALREAPAVVYPTSKVESPLSRADTEFASPMRSRYKRMQMSRMSYRRLSVWSEPDCPRWSINLVATRDVCSLILIFLITAVWMLVLRPASQISPHRSLCSAWRSCQRLLVPKRGIAPSLPSWLG